MKLHKTRKEKGVEIANHEHAKGGGVGNGQQVGPAGLVLWPSFVAFLYRFRLGLFYPSEGVLVIFHRSQADRPGLSRPAYFSFGIHPNFSGILCSSSSFGFAAQ